MNMVNVGVPSLYVQYRRIILFHADALSLFYFCARVFVHATYTNMELAAEYAVRIN